MVGSEQQNELWDAVCIINHYYEDAFRPIASQYGLTVGQLRVLHALHRFGSMSVGSLAVIVGMARANMSSLCKKLCKQGFLLRCRNGDGDERQVQLELTPEGNAAARQAESSFSSCEAIASLSDLTGMIEELREVARGLSPQGAEISRLARWKAKFTPAEDSRTRNAFRKAKTVFNRKNKTKETDHEPEVTRRAKAEETLG